MIQFPLSFLATSKGSDECETVLRRWCEKHVFSSIAEIVSCHLSFLFDPVGCHKYYYYTAMNINKILEFTLHIFHSFSILNIFLCSRIVTFKEPKRKLWKHQCYKWLFIISTQSLPAWPNGKFTPFGRRWVCSYIWQCSLIQINTSEQVYDAYNCSVRWCLLYLFDHYQLLACAAV